MGGCITSALTGASTVEVAGAVLGTVSSRAGRGVGAVAAGGAAAADHAPAGGTVMEVVTSRNDRRIDRPLLPGDRRPDGRCPVHADRLDAMAMLVSAAVGPLGRVSGCRWAGGHQHGHVVVPAAAAADMATVRPDTAPEPLLPQATTTSRAGRHGRCPAGLGHGPCGTSAVRPPARPDTSAAAVRHARPGFGHRGRTAASGVTRRVGGYGNRSSGWRPLVGCSQRRWTRASRAVSRPRSWPRT
jgi:hypothetical protein